MAFRVQSIDAAAHLEGPHADLILHRGLVTTLARSQRASSAVAIRDGRFLVAGTDSEMMAQAGPKTKVVDLKGRHALPELIDNHLYIRRGGLNCNMELRYTCTPSGRNGRLVRYESIS